MTSHSDPRSPSGSPGAPETGATKCANCDQPYERHGRIDGEGATCPDRSGQGFEPVGSPGAETPPTLRQFLAARGIDVDKLPIAERSAFERMEVSELMDRARRAASPPSVSQPTGGAATDLADVLNMIGERFPEFGAWCDNPEFASRLSRVYAAL
jgi:hypothetical protein